MTILSMAAGPLIGAVIGYCTNYIAVKMLFRPYQPVRVFGRALPFTPGIIPKRRAALSAAIGSAISRQLLTPEDFARTLTAPDVRDAVIDEIIAGVSPVGTPVGVTLEALLGSETCRHSRAALCQTLCSRAETVIAQLDITGILVREGGAAIKKAAHGSLLSMFLNESSIAGMAKPLGAAIDRYLTDHAGELLMPYIEKEADEIAAQPPEDLLAAACIDPAVLKRAISAMYDKVIAEKSEEFVARVDVAGTVQRKIDAMDMAQLESLVMSVMQKELRAVVNLGALIGFVIGLANIFL
ncbi:MAG: DUF445 family protein [Oscillospiraceae bacterium]|nr:DUF445 family protein [Oscillospiraceae bacterium]